MEMTVELLVEHEQSLDGKAEELDEASQYDQQMAEFLHHHFHRTDMLRQARQKRTHEWGVTLQPSSSTTISIEELTISIEQGNGHSNCILAIGKHWYSPPSPRIASGPKRSAKSQATDSELRMQSSTPTHLRMQSSTPTHRVVTATRTASWLSGNIGTLRHLQE
ncbi:hypothetical protein R1sor_014525 [Riccia sorocarpa]|uniref:Uncharacterized protein n=1 Tax=Riccia sorocarpa TaxID=122646 RepID=A0ABD3HBI6_9MARC